MLKIHGGTSEVYIVGVHRRAKLRKPLNAWSPYIQESMASTPKARELGELFELMVANGCDKKFLERWVKESSFFIGKEMGKP